MLSEHFAERLRPQVKGEATAPFVLEVHAPQTIGPAIVCMRFDQNLQAPWRRLCGSDLVQDLGDVAICDGIRGHVAAHRAHRIT